MYSSGLVKAGFGGSLHSDIRSNLREHSNSAFEWSSRACCKSGKGFLTLTCGGLVVGTARDAESVERSAKQLPHYPSGVDSYYIDCCGGGMPLPT